MAFADEGGHTDPLGKNLLTGSEEPSWAGQDIPAFVPFGPLSSAFSSMDMRETYPV
jgi:hypothetical protein